MKIRIGKKLRKVRANRRIKFKKKENFIETGKKRREDKRDRKGGIKTDKSRGFQTILLSPPPPSFHQTLVPLSSFFLSK
jgi:hypothetical protein